MSRKLRQSSNGAWTLTISHDIEGLTITGTTLTYDNKVLQVNTITNTEQDYPTEWVTPLGQPIIADNIQADWGTGVKNGKVYVVGGVNWDIHPQGGGGVDHYNLVIKQNNATITSTTIGSAETIQLKATLIGYDSNGEIVSTEDNVSATWDSSNPEAATVSNGSVTGCNTDTGNTKQTTITATHTKDGTDYSAQCLVTVEKAETTLSLSLDKSNFAAAGGTTTITINSNTNWTLSTNVGWATIEGGSAGSGNSTRTLRVSRNDETDDRDATVTVTGGGKSASAEITQTPPVRTLKAELSKTEISKTGETVTLYVSGSPEDLEWTASIINIDPVDWARIVGSSTGTGTGETQIEIDDLEGTQKRSISIMVSADGVDPVYLTLTQNPGPYLVVSIAPGYQGTIASDGETKLIATYYNDDEGTDVTNDPDCHWGISVGSAYITVSQGVVTGLGNTPVGFDVECILGATYNSTQDSINIRVEGSLPVLELVNSGDKTYFENLSCEGIAYPGYEASINSNIVWKATKGEDDGYHDWVHVSFDNTKVVVYIDQNVDFNSGKGGEERDGVVIISALDTSLGLPDISLNIHQAACSDLISVNTDPIIFTCSSSTAYTVEVSAWPDVSWTAEPDFRASQDTGWFDISPSTGLGNGSFTVRILEDNYDCEDRGSGYVVFKTGSSQTLMSDLEINVRQKPTPYFNVSGTVLNIGSDGGPLTIEVQTNMPITASTIIPWIKELEIGEPIRQVGGESYAEITFTVNQNTSQDGRDGTITVQSLYDGTCETFEPIDITLSQNPATVPSANYVRVRKKEEPLGWSQAIEYTTAETPASSVEKEFVVEADGKCKLFNIWKNPDTPGFEIHVYMITGTSELELFTGSEFDLMGVATFKVTYGMPFVDEKELGIVFHTENGDSGNKEAAVTITQERERLLGITDAYVNGDIRPKDFPTTANCCHDLYTELVLEIYAEKIYNSGRRTAAEQICDYIVSDPNNQQLQWVDPDKLTLTILNNPSTSPKWCYIIEDERLNPTGGYHAECGMPFKLQLTKNTGTIHTDNPTEAPFAREIQFRMNYNYHDEANDVDTALTEDFTITVPYCNPQEQDVYIIGEGGNHRDEIEIELGANEQYAVQLGGLSVGETKLTFEGDESFTESLIKDFEVGGDQIYVYADNEWTATLSSPWVSFTKVTGDDLTIKVECKRDGYETKYLFINLLKPRQ